MPVTISARYCVLGYGILHIKRCDVWSESHRNTSRSSRKCQREEVRSSIYPTHVKLRLLEAADSNMEMYSCEFCAKEKHSSWNSINRKNSPTLSAAGSNSQGQMRSNLYVTDISCKIIICNMSEPHRTDKKISQEKLEVNTHSWNKLEFICRQLVLLKNIDLFTSNFDLENFNWFSWTGSSSMHR